MTRSAFVDGVTHPSKVLVIREKPKYNRKELYMELTQKIIDKVRNGIACGFLPKNRALAGIPKHTSNRWLREAQHLIDKGEPATIPEEILLLDFYKAVELDDLRRTMDTLNEIITMTEASNDPEAQAARRKNTSDFESTRKKFDELTEQFHKVRPPE